MSDLTATIQRVLDLDEKATPGPWKPAIWDTQDGDAHAAPVPAPASDALAVLRGSWCPQCGPNVLIDEDECCAHCGATATGDGATAALVALDAAGGR